MTKDNSLENQKPIVWESHSRSLLKSLSWRILGSGFTAFMAFFLTGSLTLTMYISAGEFFAKIILFYCHERLWRIIPLGRLQKETAPWA